VNWNDVQVEGSSYNMFCKISRNIPGGTEENKENPDIK
jgi:hypothetical protein